MKAIKLLVIAAVLALATPAFSQELSFGAKVGLNLSSATIKSGGEKADDIKMLPGLNVGVFADMNFSELLALELFFLASSINASLQLLNLFGLFFS